MEYCRDKCHAQKNLVACAEGIPGPPSMDHPYGTSAHLHICTSASGAGVTGRIGGPGRRLAEGANAAQGTRLRPGPPRCVVGSSGLPSGCICYSMTPYYVYSRGPPPANHARQRGGEAERQRGREAERPAPDFRRFAPGPAAENKLESGRQQAMPWISRSGPATPVWDRTTTLACQPCHWSGGRRGGNSWLDARSTQLPKGPNRRRRPEASWVSNSRAPASPCGQSRWESWQA